MKVEYSVENLFSRLSIFGELSAKAKLDILKVSCRNNFRYLRYPNQSQKLILKQVLSANRLQDITLFEKMGKIHATVTKENYLKKILEIQRIARTIQLDRWESSVMLNIWLAYNNLCPFLRFAFNRWYDISQSSDRSTVLSLIEFSAIYLYRLAVIDKKVGVHSIHFADGSHNSLFLTKETEQIKKVPKSVGAIYFINDQEVKITNTLLRSELKKYIPHLLSYDETTKVITRQYINGETGHKLLRTNFFDRNTSAIEDLKEFFRLYKKVARRLKINLDIHPGNFVWSKEKHQWFLIDTGPIPLIGSGYFPLSSFKRYFQKIWTERHKRMREIPIRSVNLTL